jgi:hypothetical protein
MSITTQRNTQNGDCSPPEIAVVSRIKFFNPTAKESSPEAPVAGSCPDMRVWSPVKPAAALIIGG